MAGDRGRCARLVLVVAAACTWVSCGARRACLQQDSDGAKATCLSRLGESGDVTACEMAAQIRSDPWCFRRAAQATKQVDVCERIADWRHRVDCVSDVASTAKDAKLCQHIKTPKEYDQCIARVARSTPSVSICDDVRNAFRRDQCRLDCIHDFGSAACDRIENPTRKESCYLVAVGNRDGSILLCDRVTTRKTRCLVEFAKLHPDICEQVGSGTSSPARRHCYEEAFQHVTCGRIENRAWRQECEARGAGKATSRETCARMPTVESADDCLNAVARKDPALCLPIEDPDLKQSCLLKNLAKAKDGTICPFLMPRVLAQACAARFAPTKASTSTQ